MERRKYYIVRATIIVKTELDYNEGKRYRINISDIFFFLIAPNVNNGGLERTCDISRIYNSEMQKNERGKIDRK